MTRQELSAMLHHLDPGAACSIRLEVLAAMFGDNGLDLGPSAEAFAEEHGCTFSFVAGEEPRFVKSDVF
ncbi:hypothetical protein [Lutibaculum baratangense]|uniref:Uncharacterized protein n=1 Tax=Lutibaculum baratangense AMV1 TaxID=631454 RepID=V4RMD4_9HYPH|nr:hypothetical protein [Lutibaculum baratangense]ESR27191.1 hypothetical protein N177_0170 [Lutibaculum baratangense AMV1]